MWPPVRISFMTPPGLGSTPQTDRFRVSGWEIPGSGVFSQLPGDPTCRPGETPAIDAPRHSGVRQSQVPEAQTAASGVTSLYLSVLICKTGK